MKVKDMVAFLLTLDQDKEVLGADYYYDALEGFVHFPSKSLEQVMAHASKVCYQERYGDVYLLDTTGLFLKKE